MALSLRSYEPHDFAALHKLDQSCFPPGISYSKTTLRYFLTIASADCVVPVPDSGNFAALGYSRESGIPLAHGLIRNHYVGRTFIEPLQATRDFKVGVFEYPRLERSDG